MPDVIVTLQSSADWARLTGDTASRLAAISSVFIGVRILSPLIARQKSLHADNVRISHLPILIIYKSKQLSGTVSSVQICAGLQFDQAMTNRDQRKLGLIGDAELLLDVVEMRANGTR